MAASDVAIALLSETPEGGAHLRDALQELGVPVVYEAPVRALDVSALKRSHASVVIVNLDAAGDPEFDGFDELIADPRYRVVFNEADVSSELSGWEHARWARHLAAKILGSADFDPPRPADAQAVPEPEVAAIPAPPPPEPDETVLSTLSVSTSVFDLSDEEGAAGDMPEPTAPVLEQFSLADSGAADASPDAAVGEEFDAIDFELPELEDSGEEARIGDAFSIDESLLAELDDQMPAPIVEDMFSAPPPPLEVPEQVPDLMPSAPEAPASSSGASLDWSLVDLVDAQSEEPAAGPATFGVEKVSAEEFLAPAETEGAVPEAAFGSLGGLELVPLEEVVAPVAVESEARESWLDPDSVVVPAKVRMVWVLGASIGGPESVREFLGAIPKDYPALFLLAQHLGGQFVELMVRQLVKVTGLTVRTPTHGERIGHGEIIVVPATHRLQVDPEGIITMERLKGDGEPTLSIDQVLRDVSDRFGADCGAIVFSGMSDDAAEGCRYLAENGGRVYVQDPATCVASAMVDGVIGTGVAGFTGSPAELAEKLLAESNKGN